MLKRQNVTKKEKEGIRKALNLFMSDAGKGEWDEAMEILTRMVNPKWKNPLSSKGISIYELLKHPEKYCASAFTVRKVDEKKN
jgi:uncharacterized membrane-anchored protein